MRHSSFLEVNLTLLGENVEKIRSLTSCPMIPMVKADAYGNGLVPISQFLVQECGIKKLGCASLGEALRFFQESPMAKVEMLVFSDTELSQTHLHSVYSNHCITPVLHQKSDLEVVLTQPALKRVPLHLKVNTGMNRLGFSLDELAELAPRLKPRGVEHLMTHFACSYYSLREGDKTHRQMEQFLLAKKILSDAGVEVRTTSVANSGAIEQKFGLNESYIRPGLMLYGPPSVEPKIWCGHQISRLVTKVLKTFPVKKGTPVGYGINVTGEDGFMVVIPMGYGDGLLTYATGAQIRINGYSGKFFGRINMDMAFIMFDSSVRDKIKPDDMVEVWSHDNQEITDMAAQMKTIPYQLMCGITSRIPRIYKVK